MILQTISHINKSKLTKQITALLRMMNGSIPHDLLYYVLRELYEYKTMFIKSRDTYDDKYHYKTYIYGSSPSGYFIVATCKFMLKSNKKAARPDVRMGLMMGSPDDLVISICPNKNNEEYPLEFNHEIIPYLKVCRSPDKNLVMSLWNIMCLSIYNLTRLWSRCCQNTEIRPAIKFLRKEDETGYRAFRQI